MERTYESAAALADCAAGPLASHLGAFVTSLISQQYAASVIYIKVLHALAFDRWLAKRRVVLADLGETHIERYQHRSRRRHQRIRTETRRREWYEVSNCCSSCAVAVCARRPCRAPQRLTIWRPAIEQHLQDQQGLATTTIERYRTVAGQFLHERFGRGEVDLRALRADDVIAFVQRQTQCLQPPALKCVVNAMRSFLRYAQYRGEVASRSLPRCRPWPPGPPRRHCPRRYRRSMHSVRSTVATSVRGSVCAIAPCCCSWRVWGFALTRSSRCNSKTATGTAATCACAASVGREQLLPMPADVGAAIAAYLQQGRPASQDRHLFLRSMAPIRGLMPGSDAIGTIVRYALQRAKVDAPHRGSHQFRHALAVRMLQRGASLTEIGEVLRHQSPQTTSIYARVDIGALRSLAQPWPGGAR